MATNGARRFSASYAATFGALQKAATAAGYSLQAIDKVNGTISFVTKGNIYTWDGFSVLAQIISIDALSTEILVSAAVRFQVYDWGEGSRMISRLFETIEKILIQESAAPASNNDLADQSSYTTSRGVDLQELATTHGSQRKALAIAVPFFVTIAILATAFFLQRSVFHCVDSLGREYTVEYHSWLGILRQNGIDYQYRRIDGTVVANTPDRSIVIIASPWEVQGKQLNNISLIFKNPLLWTMDNCDL